MLGFKSFETAKRTISGIEIMHMIHKGQVEEIRDVLSEVQSISELMAYAA
jgi:IS6 family transposase